MIQRELQRVDLTVYLRALEISFKNPIVALAPLAAGLINITLLPLDRYGGGLMGLLSMLIDLFALGVAVIAGDFSWRYKNARFGQVWHEAKRKTSDILLAAVGITFVMFLPSFFDGMLGPLVILLQAAAVFFIAYTIPAAAIGGVPGPAALQASVDRALANPGATLVLLLVCFLVYHTAPLINSSIYGALSAWITVNNAMIVEAIIGAFTRASALGYIALVMAKVYYNAAYGRRF